MTGTPAVEWLELKPAEFLGRLEERPVAYLPIGLCEPHGHVAPFGLDTIKAEWLCRQAARLFGGIVVPTQGWHVHETGYHAPWLAEVMEGRNPRLAALPPHVLFETMCYQFRAIANAGFRALVVISGHHGAQEDMRRVASAASAAFGLQICLRTDPELVAGRFAGDHAGRYELSQLLAIRPDLVDMSRAGRATTDPLGRFAQNPDVTKASAELGREILEESLRAMGDIVGRFDLAGPPPSFIPMSAVDPVWQELCRDRSQWLTEEA